MKKFTQLCSVGILSALLSATAFACPKGTTLSGGTGANHKGGTCVPVQTKHKVTQHETTNKATTTQAPSVKTTSATTVTQTPTTKTTMTHTQTRNSHAPT